MAPKKVGKGSEGSIQKPVKKVSANPKKKPPKALAAGDCCAACLNANPWGVPWYNGVTGTWECAVYPGGPGPFILKGDATGAYWSVP